MKIKYSALKSFFILMTFSSITFAGPKDETAEKIAALSVMKKYAEAVSCAHSFEQAESLDELLGNVYSMGNADEIGDATFLIRWFGDIGCQGGSGTTEIMVSEVSRLTETRPLLVSQHNAFGNIFSEKINGLFVENMIKLNNEKFLIISYELDSNDNKHNPSKKYLYNVEFKNGKWILTSKKFLGKVEF